MCPSSRDAAATPRVRGWLAEEESEIEPPVAPAREVNTLEELRAELRGVKPRAEIPAAKAPAVEKAPREIPRVEVPRVETLRVEPRRPETPQPLPPLETQRAEPPRAEIRRMEIPRVDEPTPKLRAEEEEIKELPPLEEMIAPPASRKHEEITPRFPEEEEYEHVQTEPATFAERFASQFEESIQEPPAFQPLPELREPGLLEKSAPRLDSTTVSLAIRILIFLALVAAAVVFHRDLGNGLIWLGARLSGAGTQTASAPEVPTNPAVVPQTTPSSAQPAVSPPADTTQNPLRSTELKETSPAPSAPETRKPANPPAAATANAANSAAKAKNESTPPSGPATNKQSAQKPPSESETEAGEQEYSQAQGILKSGDREGGFQEAVRLLWIAVEKGNSKAEVSLAELYLRGEGVTRNCDQTRILLTAAARKGNAEAQRRLQTFLRQGCE